jgi:hypothetical protein
MAQLCVFCAHAHATLFPEPGVLHGVRPLTRQWAESDGQLQHLHDVTMWDTDNCLQLPSRRKQPLAEIL